MEPVISVEQDGKTEELELERPGESLLENLISVDIEISHSCGGMGTCGTCQIEVTSDLALLEERNEIETELADSRAFEKHERLACQLIPRAGLKIRIP